MTDITEIVAIHKCAARRIPIQHGNSVTRPRYRVIEAQLDDYSWSPRTIPYRRYESPCQRSDIPSWPEPVRNGNGVPMTSRTPSKHLLQATKVSGHHRSNRSRGVLLTHGSHQPPFGEWANIFTEARLAAVRG
jgi:hypothetical protein